MAVVKIWNGTDEPDYFFNKNSSTSQITLMSSYAGDDTLVNAESGVWIDAGTDNNYVSLAATGGAIANVTFSPGCRNNWHIHHASGQNFERPAYKKLLEVWFQVWHKFRRPSRLRSA